MRGLRILIHLLTYLLISSFFHILYSPKKLCIKYVYFNYVPTYAYYLFIYDIKLIHQFLFLNNVTLTINYIIHNLFINMLQMTYHIYQFIYLFIYLFINI